MCSKGFSIYDVLNTRNGVPMKTIIQLVEEQADESLTTKCDVTKALYTAAFKGHLVKTSNGYKLKEPICDKHFLCDLSLNQRTSEEGNEGGENKAGSSTSNTNQETPSRKRKKSRGKLKEELKKKMRGSNRSADSLEGQSPEKNQSSESVEEQTTENNQSLENTEEQTAANQSPRATFLTECWDQINSFIEGVSNTNRATSEASTDTTTDIVPNTPKT